MTQTPDEDHEDHEDQDAEPTTKAPDDARPDLPPPLNDDDGGNGGNGNGNDESDHATR